MTKKCVCGHAYSEHSYGDYWVPFEACTVKGCECECFDMGVRYEWIEDNGPPPSEDSPNENA